jgi:cbb3-type cytochrome oxidase cytochrome c subunit
MRKFTHELIEKNVGLLLVLIILVVSVGGLVEIVPLFHYRYQWVTCRAPQSAAYYFGCKPKIKSRQKPQSSVL